jgi:hypothetical protein
VINREQLHQRQGLTASYTLSDGTVRKAVLRSTEGIWLLEFQPEEVPFDLVWEGALHVVERGEYMLVLEGGSTAEVFLDGRPILSGGQTSVRIVPAVGLHALEVRGRVVDHASALRLLWRPPGGPLSPISGGNLYQGSVRPVGLAGRFYQSGVESGIADALRVTPAMDTFYYDPVVPEPYLAIWEGTLDAPVGGDYRFVVSGAGTVKLFLDAELRAQVPGDGSAGPNGRTTLGPGRHSIRVEYLSSSPPSQFKVLWAPPGGELQPIPIERLSPASEHMFRVVSPGK